MMVTDDVTVSGGRANAGGRITKLRNNAVKDLENRFSGRNLDFINMLPPTYVITLARCAGCMWFSQSRNLHTYPYDALFKCCNSSAGHIIGLEGGCARKEDLMLAKNMKHVKNPKKIVYLPEDGITANFLRLDDIRKTVITWKKLRGEF